MYIGKLFFCALLGTVALCQRESTPTVDGRIAKPSDIAISCRIDPETRIAKVTLVNRSGDRCFFRLSWPNLIDFEVIAQASGGKRLPQFRWGVSRNLAANVVIDGKSHIPGVWQAHFQSITLGPKQESVEDAHLGDLVDIPKAGGTFKIQIGRGLIPIPIEISHDTAQLDPAEIVWCKPVEVTFPPLQERRAR